MRVPLFFRLCLYPWYYLTYYLRRRLELLHWYLHALAEQDDYEQDDGNMVAPLIYITLPVIGQLWYDVDSILDWLERTILDDIQLPSWLPTFDITHFPLGPDYNGQ